MSELLLVAVPNGLRSQTEALIRVLVVPKLDAGSLDDPAYADLKDWPRTLTGGTVVFSMRTRTSAGNQSARRPRLASQPRSQVWAGFFSDDAGTIHQYVDKPNQAPTPDPTAGHATTVGTTYYDITRVAADPTSDVDQAVKNAIGRAADDLGPQPDGPPAGPGQPQFNKPDFHATVAALREHPRVLLDLGLVFELLVDIADLDRGDPAAGRQLSIGVAQPATLRSLVTSPWTRYDLDLTAPDTGFWPAPTGSGYGIQRGMLDLSTAATIDGAQPDEAAAWSIATFDIDGVVGNVRQAALAIAANPDAPATMPPVRSAGLVLLRPKRHLDYAARVSAAADKAAATMAETVLGAEDLVLGFHVDLRQEADWRSVCNRDARYTVGAEPEIVIGSDTAADGYAREEGHVKPFPALRDAAGRLHADEVMLRWDGWSLARRQPDLRGDATGPEPGDTSKMPYTFGWTYRNPADPQRRLPALRFTNSYFMRVRIADMAGGGLTFEEADNDAQTPREVIYRRHEPIPPPTLGATGEFSPGAAIDRLVVRSDDTMTSEQLYAADPAYPDTDTRTLDAPTAALPLVEQHGEFDGRTDEDSFPLVKRALHLDGDGGPGLPDPATDQVAAFIPKEPGGPSDDLYDFDAWGAWPNYSQKMIRLKGFTDGDEPVTMAWRDGVLTVELRRAEQATIELSSRIRANYEDHLASYSYLQTPRPDDRPVDPTATKAGRNPLVTPRRNVLVVHAVRRPLAKPRWDSDLHLQRANDDTTVVLNPTFNPVGAEGLNTDSTGRLDVAAAWREFEDVGPQANSGNRPVVADQVHTQSIPRGDPPPVRILHEFGDTKHRTITYTLKATSRFREYFKSDESEDAFRLTQPQDPVNVKSSARPPAPVVVGVVPAFRWQRVRPDDNHIEHTRYSQRLRVELARPWLATGEGEQLAVVLAPTDDSAAIAAELVTRIGRDPLFGTAATPLRPTADWLPNRHPNERQQVTLPEVNAKVIIVPFDVEPAGDRWYADVDFTTAAERFYNPLVQLAVARYQRDSLDGLQLSPVVLTDRVALLPDRHVVVARENNNTITITVTGRSPTPPNRLEAILETCPEGIDPESLDVVVTDPNAQPQLTAWRPVPKHTVERDTTSGRIPPLPIPSTQSAPGQLRLRLRETEHRLEESGGEAPLDLRRRNIFVDTIILPDAWRTP